MEDRNYCLYYVTNDAGEIIISITDSRNCNHHIIHTNLSIEEAKILQKSYTKLTPAYKEYSEQIQKQSPRKYKKSDNYKGGTRPVSCYTVDGQLVGYYESTKDAIIDLKLNLKYQYPAQIISKCLCGTRKTGCGYIWKYTDTE